MSGFDDYQDMHAARPLDDAAVELVLAGRAGPDDDLSALTAFVAEMRTLATMPPPAPSVALAAVLTAGVTAIDHADVPAATPTRARPARRITGLVNSRRRPVSDFMSRRALRLGTAGVAAKIAFGCSVAAASVTAAGAAGVLPDPVQHAVAGVVRAVSPFEFPDPAGRSDAGHQPDPDSPHAGPNTATPSSTDQDPRPAGERPSDPDAGDVHEADPARTDRPVPSTVPDGTPGTSPSPPADAPSGSPPGEPTSQPPNTPTTQPGSAPADQPTSLPTTQPSPSSPPPGDPAPQPGDISTGAPATPPTAPTADDVDDPDAPAVR